MHKKEEMLELIHTLPLQIGQSQSILVPKVKNVNKIIIAGMGGSSIAGKIIKNIIENIPLFVFRNYHLPKFVDKNTLVIITSYSGNTQETVSMYKDAKRKKAQIIIITSGGLLSKEKNSILIEKGLPPRVAIGYLFFTMLKVLEKSKLVKKQNIQNILETISKVNQNKAKEFARQLKNKIPIIYTTSNYSSVAERFKTQINENSKQHAFYNVFTELTHNEIESYHKIDKKFITIVIRDNKEEKEMKRVIKAVEEIVNPLEITLKGKTHLARIFYGIYFLDLVSYYLAVLNKREPISVSIIQKIKSG